MSVPTWNYIAVHVYGDVEIIEDQAGLIRTLEEMVIKYEKQNSSYRLDESNKEFIEGLSKGIVGFKIKINRLEGKWKLSQNHSKERQEKIINQLEQIQSEDAGIIARLMKENLSE
jgi:transcriptional regulator